MNGCDKKDVTSFSKQNNNLIEVSYCFPIMVAQTGIPSIPENKKENLSAPAFYESLKRYKHEDASNLELKDKI